MELARSLEPARDRWLVLKQSRLGDLEVDDFLLEQLTLPMFVAHGERDVSLY